ncbi:MAG: DUF4349 domain-containing protein [Flavobacteriales bacterium]|jgi:hypothetical protein|nr:DUF4349 domain-containing protein [Flavobacteriales bacterium]
MKSKLFSYFFPVLLIGLMTSCSIWRENSAATGWDYNDGSSTYYEQKDRKILLSASLAMTVEDPDSTQAKIQQVAKKYDGYISSTTSSAATIRVKSKHFDEAINELSSFGRVDEKQLQGQDVTNEYTDYQIRLENALKARERYLELLKDAKNVSETIEVEKELERLNNTIDTLKGKLQKLDHLDQYSTIHVQLKEKKKPGLLGYVGMGIYYPIKWLFVRN